MCHVTGPVFPQITTKELLQVQALIFSLVNKEKIWRYIHFWFR